MCSTENEKLLNFESSVLKVTERNCWSVVISLLRLECVKKGYSILQTLHLTCRRILDINDYCIQCVAVNAAVYRNTYNVVSFKFNEILVFSLLSIAILTDLRVHWSFYTNCVHLEIHILDFHLFFIEGHLWLDMEFVFIRCWKELNVFSVHIPWLFYFQLCIVTKFKLVEFYDNQLLLFNCGIVVHELGCKIIENQEILSWLDVEDMLMYVWLICINLHKTLMCHWSVGLTILQAFIKTWW